MDGKIIWFDSARGYGFIEPRDGGDDIFFAVEGGALNLRPGARVGFTVTDSPPGPEATAPNKLGTVTI